ncbi:unnamed protein product [Hymenolepis diminuta]|uniref:Uncharacterized protein n=1 Tax=Hymenolepis diminuta TaxID=6216 RepID=A0A564YBZ7_HYMDI|nr:unnamed protein product [Hymenolepis diminuta]
MIEGHDEIGFGDFDNECINLDVKCGSGMNHWKSGEHSYVKRIEGIVSESK